GVVALNEIFSGRTEDRDQGRNVVLCRRRDQRLGRLFRCLERALLRRRLGTERSGRKDGRAKDAGNEADSVLSQHGLPPSSASTAAAATAAAAAAAGPAEARRSAR